MTVLNCFQRLLLLCQLFGMQEHCNYYISIYICLRLTRSVASASDVPLRLVCAVHDGQQGDPEHADRAGHPAARPLPRGQTVQPTGTSPRVDSIVLTKLLIPLA